jgi:NDP-sugar pyrophosphorylase family protein
MTAKGTPVLSAIILAGAHIWQEDSLDGLCPRLLWPIGNVSLVAHQFCWLAEVGIRRVVICANSDTYIYQGCLGDGGNYDLDLAYYVDRVPRGPAGCCRDAAQVAPSEHYVVLEATVLPDLDLLGLLAAHLKSNAAATVVASRARADAGGPLQDGTPAGVYVFARRAFEHVPPIGFQDIKEMLVPRLRRAGELVSAYPVAGSPRVNDLESYLRVQHWAIRKYARGESRPQDYSRQGEALIHDQACLGQHVRLVGPVMIGPHSRLEDRAIVIGPTVIGEGCTVRAGSVIGRSVFWARCRVGAEANLDRCLVTTGASIEPHGCVYGEVCRAPGAN